MKRINRKLLMGVLTAIFALIVLGTVTYAWISLTNVATISDIEFDISTSEGIEVSLGSSSEWFSEVPSAEMLSYLSGLGYDNDFEGLQHITSSDGISFQDMDGNSITNGVDAGFISFDLRIRSLVGGQNIYLSPYTSITSNPINWKADATFSNSQGEAITAGESVTYYAANSTRMSFDDGLGLGELFVYELPEYAFGDYYSETYGNRVQSDTAQENGSVAYYNRKHQDADHLDPLSATLPSTNTSFLGADPIAVLPTEDPIDGYYESNVTVRIWLEGWDADFINALLESQLVINLQFTTTEPYGYSEGVYLEDENGDYIQASVYKEYFASVDETVTMDSVLPTYTDYYELFDSVTEGTVLADNSLVLFQSFERKEFTITFNPDFAITGDEALEIEFPDLVEKFGFPISAPVAPLNEGYSFVWYSDAEFTEEYHFTTMPQENISLYGKYEVNQYTIYFDENGGTSVSNITQDFGTAVIAPANPTRNYYTFDAWYSDEELTTAYVFSTMPSSNITLYANWDKNEYTISFESNGGSEVEDITEEFGTVVDQPDDPTKDGYTFVGWYTDLSLIFQYEFSTMPTHNITLYAKWEAS